MTVANLKAAATGQVAASPTAKFSAFLDRLKPQLALALPKHMNSDRMARLALTAFSTTPALQECTPESIAGCIMTAAQLGLEPGINGQGYLIPYKDRRANKTICTFVPGWKGLVDLVARSGRATVWTGVVFAGDEFEYQLGDAPFCRHKPADGDGLFTHVYAIGRVKDSQMPVIEVWSRGKVDKHLRQYNKVGERHYATENENNFEMYARKVALLQVLKYMPSSVELANAITVSNAAEEGKGVVLDGDFVTVQEPDLQGVDPETGELKYGEGKPKNGAQDVRVKGAADAPATQSGEVTPPASNEKAKAEEADATKPVMKYATVLDAMLKSKTVDALDEAALAIAFVLDEAQRIELQQKFDALRAELIAAAE